MGMEKQGSKSGGYVGGFLQMFDWNTKSRKKLFSNKFDLPEQSKQKKICDGNLPVTRLYMSDDDLGRTGNNRSGYYSCASSITEDEYCETKSPGVVGRLMGLDSLPKPNILDSYSTPLFDTRSLPDMHYRPKNLQDHEIMQSSNVITKPIEKFRTEILPPKSAKPVPITQHKLLSPIKSVNIIPPEDGARIMEAAARIIEPGRLTTGKGKTVRSSSAPLRVQDSKEKVLEARKPSKSYKASEKPSESSAEGQPKTKSCGESVDSKSLRVFTDSEECSSKSTGKSISLALLAKANVQKREGLSVSGRRILVNQDEQNSLIKSQSSTQKTVIRKQSTQDGPLVFRENNQKQNGVAERRKSPSVKLFASNSQGGEKVLGGDSSARRKNLSKPMKVGSTRSSLEGKDDKTNIPCSSSQKLTSKKPSKGGDYQYKRNQATNNTLTEKSRKMIQSSWDKDEGRKGMDVVSFTFAAPMTRSEPGSTQVREKCKRTLVGSDGLNVSKFSFPGHNILRGDALSTLLEQKLKELTNVVEFPQRASRSPSHFQDPGLNASTLLHEGKTNDGVHKYNQISQFDSSFSDDRQGSNSRNQFKGMQEMEHIRSKVCEAENLLDPWLPSPVSILEQSLFAESYSSLDTVDSSSTTGSRQCSSVQAQEVLSMKKLVSTEGDTELADSASSISLSKTHSGKSTEWELKYVKEVMCSIELMFKDYALCHSREVINPNLFDQLANRKGTLNGYDVVPKTNRRLLFDCVSECLESKCRGYVCSGSQMWAKGVSVIRRKEKLAQEVYSEILGWSSMGDCMVDELVDKDMSSRDGRWLDFETEAYELGKEIEDRVLDSLLDEVVADILVL